MKTEQRWPKPTPVAALIFLTAGLLWAVVGVAGAAGTVSVRCHEEAEIAADAILLGSIGQVDGADAAFVRRLETVVLGRAPLPGKTRTIDRAAILTRIKQSGIDPAGLDLQIPAEVVVTRASMTVAREQIERIVRAYIEQQGAGAADALRIREIRVSEPVVLPLGRLTTRVAAPKNTDWAGAIPLSVVFTVDEEEEKRAWVTVSIERLTRVVVARRPLGRYKPIDEDDVEVRAVDAAGLPEDRITQVEAVIGKRTRRPVDTGTVLRPELVEFPPLVKNGDRVRIIAEMPGLRISAFGQVKQKGAQGDVVQVMNLDSNKVVYARVLDAQTVKIDF
jgi:flagella basal body P-ring formation protein FlgA